MPGGPHSVSSEELIRNPKDLGPHVVILGAGASRAAFPNGDANGRQLPLMNDLVKAVGLAPLLRKYRAAGETENFESLYTRLYEDPATEEVRTELERRIADYFSRLRLPEATTIYDLLLLSLRNKDAVLTFNWDPFLFDAWERNRDFNPPPIYFLHGNVRVRSCLDHTETWGEFQICPLCGRDTVPSPLLYPVETKDYESDPFIRMHWIAAQTMLRAAFTVTVFGYSAPHSDRAAMGLIHTAYTALSDRKIGHFEVIDVNETSILDQTWAPFVPTHHLTIRRSFSDS